MLPCPFRFVDFSMVYFGWNIREVAAEFMSIWDFIQNYFHGKYYRLYIFVLFKNVQNTVQNVDK